MTLPAPSSLRETIRAQYSTDREDAPEGPETIGHDRRRRVRRQRERRGGTADSPRRRRLMPILTEALGNPMIKLARLSILDADAKSGRRNLRLRALDRAGLGFNS